MMNPFILCRYHMQELIAMDLTPPWVVFWSVEEA